MWVIPKWEGRTPGIMGGDDGLKLFVLEHGIKSVNVIIVYEDRNGDMRAG